MVGQLLDKLNELGIDDNTIVMYSTDNGAEAMSWPDGGTTPFPRREKHQLGRRLSRACAIRWPGVIKPGTIINDIVSHEDMLPTLLAAAGVPDVKEQLLKGMKVGDKTFKVHLDGYNITDTLAGKAKDPRHEFFYLNDDGSLVGLRYDNWKIVFQNNARRDSTMAGAVRHAACSQALQPSLRSVRKRGPRRLGLRPLAHRPHLRAGAGPAIRRAIPGHVQGIPAEPESRQLLLDQVLDKLQDADQGAN